MAIVPTGDPRALGLAELKLFLRHHWLNPLRIDTFAPGAAVDGRRPSPSILRDIGKATNGLRDIGKATNGNSTC